MPTLKIASFKNYIIYGLTLLAFGLRLHTLNIRSLWYDELLELDIAQGPIWEINAQLVRHAAMPLDYYLLHGWLRLGRQEAWVRFPALLFGVLAIPMIYILGRHFFGRRVGLVAAALLTLSPFAISYSQETRPYALLLFMVTVAIFGLWQAFQRHQHRYWIIAIVGLVGAVASHYFALFLLLPVALFVGVQQVYHLKDGRYWQHTGLFGLSLLLIFVILIPDGRLLRLYSVGDRFARESYQLETYTAPADEKLNGGSGPPISRGFFLEKMVMPLSTINLPVLLLFNAFFLVGLLSLLWIHPGRRPAILLLLAWLLLPPLLIYLFLLHRGTFYAIRYILYTLPAYLLLVAYGLDLLAGMIKTAIKQISGRRSNAVVPLLLLLALLPLVSAQFDQLATFYRAGSREDWRVVGQTLWANATPTDAIIAVRAEPAINWYYPPATAPFGTFSRSQPIWEAIRQHERRWFILSSYSFRRDKGLRDWLDQQGAVTIAIDRRVVVHFHEAGKSKEELLEQVKDFSLPQKAMTYRVLAAQFQQEGDFETSRLFFRRARELAQNSSRPAPVARLPGPQ